MHLASRERLGTGKMHAKIAMTSTQNEIINLLITFCGEQRKP